MKADPPLSAADIFADALALSAGERSAFLDAACAGDASLRAEVESLLAAFPAAEAAFDAAATQARNVAQLVAPALEDPHVGRQIGAWRLVRLIASGGMGAVYLGERTDDSFRKQVAIKLIRPQLGGGNLLARFRTERQVLADLEHPGIARLVDGGSTPDGLPYLAMEYVSGLPITRHCRENDLPLDRRLELFLEVCDAVQYAHANLIIHRDLKPSNIFVDTAGRTRLLDFGIAKVIEPDRAEAAEATLTEMRVFTPQYASPEQVRGGRITTSTDVYSLGVVLYELLTGAPPFPMEEQTRTDWERALCEDPPTRPSRMAPGRMARRLSGDLDTILLKALRKEPERRYHTVEDFAGDIRRHLAGLPVEARPDTAGYRVSRFARRHKGLVASVAAIVAILAVALVVTLNEYRRATARTREAQWLAYSSSMAAAESSILQNEVEEASEQLQAAPAHLRGWEWHHLRARLDRSLGSWKAHAAGITRVVALGRGDTLASCSIDSTVKLWDARSGRMLRTWGPFRSEVESVALDPARRWIGAGLNNGAVMLLPLAGGPAREIAPAHDGWAMVAFSPDGRQLGAGFKFGEVRLWDVQSGDLLEEWKGHGAFATVAFAPGKGALVSGGSDGAVRVWSMGPHRLLREFPAHTRRILAMAFSADGKFVVTGSMDRTAQVRELATGRLACTFREHRASVTGLAFDPGGRRVVSSGGDGQTLVWDAETGRRLSVLRGHKVDVSALVARANGSEIVTADWSGVIKRWTWDAEDVRILSLSDPSRIPPASQVSFNPDGSLLVCAADAESLGIWQVGTRRPPYLVNHSWTTRAAFAPADGRLVSGDKNGGMMISDAKGSAGEAIPFRGGSVRGIAFNRAGDIMATASADSGVVLWSYPGLRQVRSITGHKGGTNDVTFTRDGRQVVTCGADSAIRAWDVSTGAAVREFRGHSGEIRDIEFSPDGRSLASASSDGTVRVWDVGSAKPPRVLVRRQQAMSAVAFSRDGTRLASGGADQLIRLFDTGTGREIVSLHGHVGHVLSLAFGAGDMELASASVDGTVRLWERGP